MEEEVTLRGRDLYLGVVAVDAAGNAGQVSNIVQCQGIQNPFAAGGLYSDRQICEKNKNPKLGFLHHFLAS